MRYYCSFNDECFSAAGNSMSLGGSVCVKKGCMFSYKDLMLWRFTTVGKVDWKWLHQCCVLGCLMLWSWIQTTQTERHQGLVSLQKLPSCVLGCVFPFPLIDPCTLWVFSQHTATCGWFCYCCPVLAIGDSRGSDCSISHINSLDNYITW